MKKGRNKDLIELRNKKLIERYYYWTEIKRRRFDDVLQILSRSEFFLAEKTILNIIQDNNDLFEEIRNKSS